jgi:GH15 family glucan-1,4-alpha-glucosidase
VRAYFPLDAGTMAVGAGGELVRVFDVDALVPGTRVVAGTPDSARQAAEQRAWLAAGEVPQPAGLGDSTMVRDALLDLYVLSRPYGVAVAAWAPAWRYVWPRDSALVASALARTGHLDDAERVISFLAQAQPESGVFEARYRPDGSGVPDERGVQVDSVGWALWAMAEVARELPAADRLAFMERHGRLLERSSRAALTLVDNPRSLPAPSPDYWEREEADLTLSTAALVSAGLAAAGELYLVVGDERRAAVTSSAGQRVRGAIEAGFAAHGYPRTIGGTAASVDLGVSYLLPPYAVEVDPEVLQVWRGSASKMARPAGGLAPGGSWRDDGVSWNTATSSYAMSAAFVDRDAALSWLRWLDRHRTGPGSLPEKVLYDGEPASVAPLAWPAAAVVIATDELQQPRR